MAYRTPSQCLGSRCLAEVPDSYYAEEPPESDTDDDLLEVPADYDEFTGQ